MTQCLIEAGSPFLGLGLSLGACSLNAMDCLGLEQNSVDEHLK